MSTTTADVPTVDLTPARGRVCILPDPPPTETAFGLALPDVAQEWPQHGLIVSVGPPRLDAHGREIPNPAEVGSRVVFSRHGGTEITREGEKYVLTEWRDVLAIVHP